MFRPFRINRAGDPWRGPLPELNSPYSYDAEESLLGQKLEPSDRYQIGVKESESNGTVWFVYVRAEAGKLAVYAQDLLNPTLFCRLCEVDGYVAPAASGRADWDAYYMTWKTQDQANPVFNPELSSRYNNIPFGTVLWHLTPTVPPEDFFYVPPYYFSDTLDIVFDRGDDFYAYKAYWEGDQTTSNINPIAFWVDRAADGAEDENDLSNFISEARARKYIRFGLWARGAAVDPNDPELASNNGGGFIQVDGFNVNGQSTSRYFRPKRDGTVQEFETPPEAVYGGAHWVMDDQAAVTQMVNGGSSRDQTLDEFRDRDGKIQFYWDPFDSWIPSDVSQKVTDFFTSTTYGSYGEGIATFRGGHPSWDWESGEWAPRGWVYLID